MGRRTKRVLVTAYLIFLCCKLCSGWKQLPQPATAELRDIHSSGPESSSDDTLTEINEPWSLRKQVKDLTTDSTKLIVTSKNDLTKLIASTRNEVAKLIAASPEDLAANATAAAAEVAARTLIEELEEEEEDEMPPDDGTKTHELAFPENFATFLYVLSAINPAIAVFFNDYSNANIFRIRFLEQYKTKTASKSVMARTYDTLFYFARLKPRVAFAIGSTMRALQLNTALQSIFDPSYGVACGLNMLALFTNSKWPAAMIFGWCSSKLYWKVLGAMRPSDIHVPIVVRLHKRQKHVPISVVFPEKQKRQKEKLRQQQQLQLKHQLQLQQELELQKQKQKQSQP